MSMRIRTWTTAGWLIAAGFLATPAAAQDRSGIELTRQKIQTDRQALVAVGMELTEAEANAFWPIYRDYRGQLGPIGDRLLALISGYAEDYGTLTDEHAQQILYEFLDIQEAQLALQRKFVPDFLGVLPPLKVARFYQLENKLDAVIKYEAAMAVPILK